MSFSAEHGIHRGARDDELARFGWRRRFIGAPPRLDEVRELYEGMGLEVHFDELSNEELREGCDGCVLALSLFRVVYTRPPVIDDAAVHDGPIETDNKPSRESI